MSDAEYEPKIEHAKSNDEYSQNAHNVHEQERAYKHPKITQSVGALMTIASKEDNTIQKQTNLSLSCCIIRIPMKVWYLLMFLQEVEMDEKCFSTVLILA